MLPMVAQFGFKFIVCNAEIHIAQDQLAKQVAGLEASIDWKRREALPPQMQSNPDFLAQMSEIAPRGAVAREGPSACGMKS